jgi:hypothetical protein
MKKDGDTPHFPAKRGGVSPFSYLANLSPGKIVLWCFLIWYLATVIHHFDPTPAIWLNALGISAIIGVALYLSVREPEKPPPDLHEMLISLAACAVFVSAVLTVKRLTPH